MNSSTLVFPDFGKRPSRISPRRPILPGSRAHKMLFCRTLLNMFNTYRSAVLNWRTIPMLVRLARRLLRKANRPIGT